MPPPGPEEKGLPRAMDLGLTGCWQGGRTQRRPRHLPAQQGQRATAQRRGVAHRHRHAQSGSRGAVAVPGDGWCGPPVSSAARAAAVHERQWLIKRVAAAPGDPVPRPTVPALAHTADGRVHPGRLVLLGDNAAGSFDSRQLGSFPADRVLGVVILPRPRPPVGG